MTARRLIESGQPLMVCKTVVVEHLLAVPQVTVEDHSTVEQALAHCEAGLALADALHHATISKVSQWRTSRPI